MKSHIQLPIETARDPLYCSRECPHYGRAMGLHQCGLFGNLRLSPYGVHRAGDCVKTEVKP